MICHYLSLQRALAPKRRRLCLRFPTQGHEVIERARFSASNRIDFKVRALVINV
jgi:hypothetical protein